MVFYQLRKGDVLQSARATMDRQHMKYPARHERMEAHTEGSYVVPRHSATSKTRTQWQDGWRGCLRWCRMAFFVVGRLGLLCPRRWRATSACGTRGWYGERLLLRSTKLTVRNILGWARMEELRWVARACGWPLAIWWMLWRRSHWWVLKEVWSWKRV